MRKRGSKESASKKGTNGNLRIMVLSTRIALPSSDHTDHARHAKKKRSESWEAGKNRKGAWVACSHALQSEKAMFRMEARWDGGRDEGGNTCGMMHRTATFRFPRRTHRSSPSHLPEANMQQTSDRNHTVPSQSSQAFIRSL